jgi:hypothetical protein
MAHRRTRHALTTALGPVILAVVAAGCGGGTNPNRPAGTGSKDGPGSQAVAFAACMRAHGVPNFPDPKITHNGRATGVSQAVPASVGQSPAFAGAQKACAKLAPGETGPATAGPITATQRAKMLAFASCVRSHGYPNFPDPNAQGVFEMPAKFNQGAPGFQSTASSCLGSGGFPVNMASGSPGGP